MTALQLRRCEWNEAPPYPVFGCSPLPIATRGPNHGRNPTDLLALARPLALTLPLAIGTSVGANSQLDRLLPSPW